MAVVNDSCSEVRGSAGHRPKRDRLVKEWDGHSQAPGFLSSSPPSSFCLLDQHAPRLSNTTTCLRLAIEWAALHNDSLTGIHNYMAFILSRQDMFKELSVVLNAVVSVHAVEVWTQDVLSVGLSECNYVGVGVPRQKERGKKITHTQSRSWRASVPPWISANSPERGRPLPNYKTVRRLTQQRGDLQW